MYQRISPHFLTCLVYLPDVNLSTGDQENLNEEERKKKEE